MSTTFNITFRDNITVNGNTTPAKVGDFITVTFPSVGGCFTDFTILDDQGKEKRFEVIERTGLLGILYPGRDASGDWLAEHFTPFDKFSHTVIFEIAVD